MFVFLLRLFEWYLINSAHALSNNFFDWQIHGLFFDFFQLTILLLFILVLFLIIKVFSTKVAKIFSILIIITVLIFQTLLIYYFKEAITPLTVDDIYGMSTAQVELLIELYGFKTIYLFILIPFIIVLTLVFYKLTKLLKHRYYQLFSTVILIVSTLFFIIKPLAPKNFDSEIQYQSTVNKTTFFVKSYLNYDQDNYQYIPEKTQEIISTYYDLHNIRKIKYYNYPFFKSDTIKDVLTPFFKPSKKSPNIVFIISESLGKQYSGTNPNLTSFTPFLDSLAEHSLYWENMIANAERTFGALPNILAGVSEGPKGFLNLRWNMTDHLSLPLILKEQNNYQTGFYCGASKVYDFMSDYLMFQKFDHILGKSNFRKNVNEGKFTKDGVVKSFNWGAEDFEVFKQSIEYMNKTYDTLKPFFNLYLSTSFHQPFAYTNQNEFIKKANNWIMTKVIPEEQEQYKIMLKSFAALMYADYSMQQLFEMYKKAGLYENTIFVIIGDHSLKFMNANPRLEKYHIPLIIHSPLLKRFNNSKSIVCQKDVPSAMQALLKNNFGLTMPNFSISQSNNLDTNQNLSAKNVEFVLMYANKYINNYIENDYFISDNILFKINEGMQINRVEDEVRLEHITAKMKNYKQLLQYVCFKNMYIPKQEFLKYATINYELDYHNNFSLKSEDIFKTYSTTSTEYYSKPKSIESGKIKYFEILKTKVKNTERLRVVLKYKIKSATNYYPNIVISTSKGGEEVKNKTIVVDKTDEYLKPTIKENWKSVVTNYWIDKNSIDEISIYLFNNDEVLFYFDDLEIEIRAF